MPLIDLPTFYPPRLPIGAGTALGAALNHLMSEIDHQVVPTTPTRKGDWKPIVYLLTDGKPTDAYQAAIQRWSQSYAKRSYVIAIGLGPYADTSVLSQFANDVLSYNGEDETDFARFIQWMTMSVSSQSMAVENRTEGSISLEKAGGVLEQAQGNKPSVDKDCVVFVGRCQRQKTPYLLKYERAPNINEMIDNLDLSISAEQPFFQISGCFPVEEDYFDWSGSSGDVEPMVNVNSLVGGAGCPYCGNDGGKVYLR
ncbi:tellurium resistance protein [Candidatus Thiomargarita nelsonii]|uniref:Tellurium resistance protein n=1 Tax=Candidatus Thiomargarita nelsonii TaxID=1003181 RepID=A0A176S1B8_9GAMM|nr:tellurium resistance protein [Candidatus Thiomargarita nelsonii]